MEEDACADVLSTCHSYDYGITGLSCTTEFRIWNKDPTFQNLFLYLALSALPRPAWTQEAGPCLLLSRRAPGSAANPENHPFIRTQPRASPSNLPSPACTFLQQASSSNPYLFPSPVFIHRNKSKEWLLRVLSSGCMLVSFGCCRCLFFF